MNKSENYYQSISCISKINIIYNNKFLVAKDIIINVNVCPRILIKQRFCCFENLDRKIVKVIISLINYEKHDFKNIYLEHRIIGSAYQYQDLSLYDNITFSNEGIIINLANLPALMVKSFNIDFCVLEQGDYYSEVLLRDCFGQSPDIICSSSSALLRII